VVMVIVGILDCKTVLAILTDFIEPPRRKNAKRARHFYLT
jgi:hypothetical protein